MRGTWFEHAHPLRDRILSPTHLTGSATPANFRDKFDQNQRGIRLKPQPHAAVCSKAVRPRLVMHQTLYISIIRSFKYFIS